MKATLKLSESEIMAAIREYVERNGWQVAGDITLSHSENYDSRNQPMGALYSAALDVVGQGKERA